MMEKSETTISKKIKMAYEKYAPKNITLEQFAQIIEQQPDLLDAIGGSFSSFSPELSIAFKKYKNKKITEDEFRKIAQNSINTESMERVSQNYVKLYENIICSDDDILRSAWTFKALTREQKQDLAVKIIDSINKHFDIENKVKVVYADKNMQLPFKQQIHIAVVDLVKKALEKIEDVKYVTKMSGYYNEFFNTIAVLQTDDFPVFMGILSHEYGHYIDINYPNLGMLGSQISFYDREFYSTRVDNDAYRTNPTETSSLKIEDIVSERIKRVLLEQATKKTALYLESLKFLISYYKLKISGLRMKYNKVFKTIEKLKQDYSDLESKLLKELFPGIDLTKIPAEQMQDIVLKLKANPKLKAIKAKREQFDKKIPKEYNELEDDLCRCDRLIKEYNSNQEGFSKSVQHKLFLLEHGIEKS